MAINENVYGSPEEWILSSFEMSETYFAPWETLGNGVTAEKIRTNAPIDKSIGYVGLGVESPYCDIISINSSGNVVHDYVNVRNFFFAYGDPITYDYYIPNDGSAKTWNVDGFTPYDNNYNKLYRPIVSYNLKRILWNVMIIASSVVNPSGYGDMLRAPLATYANNATLQSQYPYLKAAFMFPLVDQSSTDTPNRTDTLIEPMLLCINDQRHVENFEFITFNDLNIMHLDGNVKCGILLRGSTEGLGNSYISSTQCVYYLGNENAIQNVDSTYLYAELYSDSVKDEIIKAAACFCCYFVGDDPIPNDVSYVDMPLDNSCVYLGKPDEHLIGHGDYTKGADNVNNPLWEWENIRESDYDYTYNPINYDNTQFGSGFISSAFTKFYALDLVGVGQLSNTLFTFLQNRDPNIPIDVFLSDNFLTTNPLDLIVSLKKMPFNISQLISMSSDTVSIGKMSTAINCKSTTGAILTTKDMGNISIPEHYGDFRDYEPYTTYELIVPFCGSIKLNAAEVVGKTMILKMAVDPFTGDCTCYILVEGKIIESLSGNCAIDLPIAGEQSATLTNAIANARTNVYNAKLSSKQMTQSAQYSIFSTLGNSALSMFGSGKSMTKLTNYTGVGSAVLSAGGTALNAIHGAENAGVEIGKAEYDLSHTVIPIKSIGGQSGVTNLLQPMTADLLIERCIMLEYDPEVYAQTTGFACLLNGTVNDFSGLTVGNIVLDGVSCSLTEKELIKKAFATGVYL